MRRDRMSLRSVQHLRATLLGVLGVLLVVPSAPGADVAQKTFPTAEAAAEALVAAARADDTTAMLQILGPDAKSLVISGDPVADDAARERFVSSWDEGHQLVPGAGDTTVVQTGKDAWPLPIPLVDTTDGWRFDTDAGRDEMINRRVGANELATIQTCLAYVDAQRDYQDMNPQQAKIAPYAQKVASTPGKKDGLYWDGAEGEPESPLGPLFASARGEGYAPGKGKPIPYHGYYYRILTAQGPHAPGGAYDYVVRGQMIGGFALVAYPAEYASSGVMTFLVNHDGVVYEKDLGADTAKIARAMKTFDPDDTWRKVDADAKPERGASPPGAS